MVRWSSESAAQFSNLSYLPDDGITETVRKIHYNLLYFLHL